MSCHSQHEKPDLCKGGTTAKRKAGGPVQISGQMSSEKTDLAGRILQWAFELSEFDLKYETRTAIKSQYLADFIAEYTDIPGAPVSWNLYVDGSTNKAKIGAGIILESDQGTKIELSLKFEFLASNNQAEYEALLAGLRLAKEVRVQKLTIFSDSQVITTQIEGSY
nr:uncharacterized protein LOC112785745 [Arachis hypogaea]